ncbi:insulin-like growth factor-binding protein complex acid labile subunit [Venturia canescens]|uniref:insulin-like growth factor-binding protein complex acid labile subunit n=1 Tax=Venturia canescens TaxID=32260 RepID=UPI001C9C726E|nr:insulin-like growth factor-binding protein complex acid labile subunit [Venturia canescens]
MENTRCALFFAILGLTSALSSITFPFCENLKEHEMNLNFSNIGITRLKQSFVSNDFIKCLSLNSNGLSTIESDAFEGLPNLEALDLSDNSLDLKKFLQSGEFTNFTTLILDSAFKKPEEFGDPYEDYRDSTGYGDFYKLYRDLAGPTQWDLATGFFPKLQKLSFSNYGTLDVQDWLENFEMVTNLTHLRLNANLLINSERFPTKLLQNLTHFWLDDNSMKTFVGQDSPKVRYLSMNKNEIKNICSFSCNNISYNDQLSLHSMTELEYLSLVDNKIKSVDFDAFSNSVNLRTLNLAKNCIEAFPRETFKNAISLESLRLDYNRLELVPDLCGLINLRELWIIGNRIKTVDETSFCHLPKLSVISLQNNQLTIVAPQSFGNLPKLQTLDMSVNSLAQLSPGWSGPGSQILNLNLTQNKFQNISDMPLEQLDHLQILTIERNPIKTLTIRSLSNLPPNTTIAFDCSCENNDLETSTHPIQYPSGTIHYNPNLGIFYD